MAYTHGIKVSEVPTSILPAVSVSASIPFIVGTAPVNMTDPSNVNKPILCYSYDEAVKAFGYVPPKDDIESGLKKYEYSISEFIRSQFALFGVGPVIIVNVLDPKTHKATTTTKSITLDSKTGSFTVAETGILLDTVTITASGGSAYVKGTDYEVAFDDDGQLVVTSLKDAAGEFKCDVGESISFAAEKCDPTAVEADDIVGGVSVDGKKSGFELVNECWPRFRLTPGILLAPGYSQNATVAAVMAAKAVNINELFKAVALIDVPTDTVKQYTEIADWKDTNNVVDPSQVALWPMVALDGVAYHMSTQAAGVIGKTDSAHDDVPYKSPSNERLQMTASVLADGTEVFIDPSQGSYLESQGIVTALNFSAGWVLWGNRTACYPGNTDVKDSFISIRRMFGWIGNTIVQTYWQKLDDPLNPRQINTVVGSANIWLNGLAARQFILGGRVEFLGTENPTTDLMDGISRFHVFVTPPSPNREQDWILEYDPQYIQTLFG